MCALDLYISYTMLHYVTGEKMGVVRIDDKLKNEILEYISKEENKYNYPNISTFINTAIFEKLKKVNGGKNGKK